MAVIASGSPASMSAQGPTGLVPGGFEEGDDPQATARLHAAEKTNKPKTKRILSSRVISPIGSGQSHALPVRCSAHPIPQGHGHVEVPLLHEPGIVMQCVMTPELPDRPETADEALRRQMVGQVEPFVGD